MMCPWTVSAVPCWSRERNSRVRLRFFCFLEPFQTNYCHLHAHHIGQKLSSQPNEINRREKKNTNTKNRNLAWQKYITRSLLKSLAFAVVCEFRRKKFITGNVHRERHVTSIYIDWIWPLPTRIHMFKIYIHRRQLWS